MQDLSLHILDIVENSVQAHSTLIEIKIMIDTKKDILTIKLKDNGIGMDKQTIKKAQNPFYTSKTERKKKVGLGIPLFKQNAEHCNGSFQIESTNNKGTEITAVFQYSHIDRMPLGNLKDTFINCIIAHPNIDFNIKLVHKNDKIQSFDLSTKEIKQILGNEIPLSHPDVYEFLNENLNEGIKKTHMEEL
jgi:DNA mismatch repair ATPase MutL